MYTPAQAAKLLSDDIKTVSPATVRHWCKLYGVYLSDSATPKSDVPRLLSDTDIQVLKEVSKLRKQVLKEVSKLRKQGLKQVGITAKLADMEFGQVVPSDEAIQATQSPPLAVEPSEALAILNTGLDSINTNISAMQRRIEKVEEQQIQRFDLGSFMMGIGVAVVFMVLVAVIIVSVS